MLRAFDWIFIARPIVLIPAWAFLIVGYFRANERSGEFSPPLGPLLLPFVLLTVVLAGAYIVNQIYDRETDKENGKLFLIAEGHVSVRGAWIEAVLLMAGGLAASLVLRPGLLPWLLASALLGLLYSVPPARFKGRPVLDLVANACGYGAVTFLFGFSLAGRAGAEEIAHALPYVLLVGAVFLHTALVDQDGDRKAGMRTTAVALGDRATSAAALVLLALAGLAGVRVGEPYVPPAAIGASPFFLWGALFPGRKGSTLAYQWGSLLFVLLVVMRVPLFGLLLVLLVAATRAYYRFRLNLVYPRLDF
ncbi:MAG: UbiA family prenyltransferase [Candidatus Eisenbacteria bacterium]